MRTLRRLLLLVALALPLMPTAAVGAQSPPPKVRMVIAEGVGTDVQSATQSAAQNALTGLVGSFMDSNQVLERRSEISDGIQSQTRSIRSDIREYSQGTIQRIEIVDVRQQAGLVRVTASVTVRIEDFRAYILKLAEGEADIGGGLFPQMTAQQQQAANLTALLADRISAVQQGEVSRIDVSAPSPLSVWGAQPGPNAPVPMQDLRQSTLARLLRGYSEQQIIFFEVRVHLDPAFHQNLLRTLEETARDRKRFVVSQPSLGYTAAVATTASAKLHAERNQWEFGQFRTGSAVAYVFDPSAPETSAFVGYAFSISPQELSRTIPVANQCSNALHGIRASLPSLEVGLLSGDGNVVDAYSFEARDFRTGPAGTSRAAIQAQDAGVPWSLLQCSSGGSSGRFPVIHRERRFHVFLAVSMEALRSADRIKVKLVH